MNLAIPRVTGRLVLLYLLMSGATSCRHPQSGGSELLWGHLADSELAPTSPQFLINKKPGQPLTVCLARYMTEELPGIEAEIEASVNIWSFYLGRRVPVNITVADLPPPEVGATSDSLRTSYYKICGDQFDLVVGKVPFKGDTLGETGVTFSFFKNADQSKKIVSFKRHLFLRDFEKTPLAPNVKAQWLSSGQRSKAPAPTAEELLDSMAARNDVHFALDERYLELPVLVHEMGHVWGLCDQYEGVNNCDPTHSTSHPVFSSIMGASSTRQNVFLTDDDIEGVRALEARPGFAADWPVTDALTAVAQPVSLKPVELFTIHEVKSEAKTLVLIYSIVTSVPAEFRFQVQRPSGGAWIDIGQATASDKAVSIVRGTMKIGLNAVPKGWQGRILLKLKASTDSVTPLIAGSAPAP